jgi:hypothetical protein
MITLNGKKFAKNDDEFTSSLFDKSGTCVGFYKRMRNSVKLFDMQKNLIGVINKHGCLCCATMMESGQYWYSFATIKLVGEYDSYSQSVAEPKNILAGA